MSLREIAASQERAQNNKSSTPLTGLQKVLHISFELQGETLQATLTAEILSFDASLRRDRALVQLAAPERYDDLPAMVKLRLYALATLSQALKDPPEWLNDWIGRYDPLLFAIYEEVSAHERAFFRGHMETGAEGEGEQPLVKIRALDAPPA